MLVLRESRLEAPKSLGAYLQISLICGETVGLHAEYSGDDGVLVPK